MPEEHHGTDKWFDDIWNNIVVTTQSSIQNLVILKLKKLIKYYYHWFSTNNINNISYFPSC